MLTIIIFNKDYARFLDKLFEGILFCNNRPDINVFFLDDGSSDNSNEKAKELGSFIKNFYYIQLTPKGNKRPIPSLGQLKGLQYILKNYQDKLNEYIQFLDSDDWLSNNFFYNINSLLSSLKYQLIFHTMVNAIGKDEPPQNSIYPIKRKIGQFKSRIWPTIMPTSSILLSKKFLKENEDAILDQDPLFYDVWLDSRINILAMNISSNLVYYSSIFVYRRLHENNDSFKGGFKRKILKQKRTASYMDKYLRKNMLFNLRTFLLKVI